MTSSKVTFAQSKKTVAQALIDQEHLALSAFVTSLNDGHPSLSVVVPPAGLKEYWETIRSQGVAHGINLKLLHASSSLAEWQIRKLQSTNSGMVIFIVPVLALYMHEFACSLIPYHT